MSDLRTCDHCGENFDTITECRIHQDDCDLVEPNRPAPDYNDPFSPERNGDREMECIHCGDTFNESEILYERRSHQIADQPLWYCPNDGCTGAGVGVDLRRTLTDEEEEDDDE